MTKILIYIVITVPAILAGLGIAVYIFQERLIFHPEKLSKKYKFVFDQDFEEKNYQTADGNTISALLFKVENSKGIVFYHHGNAGSLDSWGVRAIDFTSKGYDVLMYDYRSYGKSTGEIKSEKMLFADAIMIYKELLYDYKEREIIVYGTSLGTGIASYVAYNHHPSKLILETPYYNFYDVAKFHYPYLPNSLLLNYQFKIDQFLPKMKSEVYLFHGTEDETVPYNSSERLAKLSDKITFFTIKDGSHNNLNTFHDYHKWLSKVLE
ncbi:MAG: alpha/beta hydrolase [Flavobacteriales bacterium]|nr:alpha/beta hydrolase [Flavobacteriales bacterium]